MPRGVSGEMFEVRRGVRALDVSYSKIDIFPPALFLFPRLAYLNISGNSLSVVPPAIATLCHLHTLDLRCDVFDFNILSFFMNNFRSKNSIQYLPNQLADLHRLKHLDITDNPLEGLPSSLRTARKSKQSTRVRLDSTKQEEKERERKR